MLMRELRLFFIAVQFLTRLPVPRWVGFDPDALNQSARHFPAVGACIGALAAGVLWVGGSVFPPLVAAVLAIAATLLLTGALHEDGLADTCDALGGAVGRERALQIMKDSRIGSYGALGLITVLGLKAAVLAALPLDSALPALLLAHCASRAAAVWLIRALPYAGDIEQAKARPLARRISRAGAAVALAWVAGLAALLLMLAPAHAPALALSLLLCGAGTLGCALGLRRRLGGYTGDTLGATQQMTEVLMLLAWLGCLGAARCMG